MLIPVRHHSPACARLVRDTILQLRPAAVLIEGPADFNERIGELGLGHQLPIAIYSYCAWADGRRQGAYYPFCEHSPEWQALEAARAVGADARFIDLPFAARAGDQPRVHLYADESLRSSDYVAALCRALGVDDFDGAWDLIAEHDPALDADALLARVATYCDTLREADGDAVPASDLERETFMAAHVRAAYTELGAERVVVVIGGYHRRGLEELLHAEGPSKAASAVEIDWPEDLAERGLALTPYSDERLDRLRGYDAGMPSPGFYRRAWSHREDGEPGEPFHLELLAAVAARLRGHKQPASTADLIAVELCARGLASLRGHAQVWRRDLIDGILAALVKDDLHGRHPFQLALEDVLRGDRRGRLADGAPLPPLTRDIQRRLAAVELTPAPRGIERSLLLTDPAQLGVSALLQGLRVLGLPGFVRVQGIDLAGRGQAEALREIWRVAWTPEQDAAMIEASRFGSAVDEAVAAALTESAREIERDAAAAARLLLDAVLAGVLEVADALRGRIGEILRQDGDLARVAEATGHLLHLFAWDSIFGARGSRATGELLAIAFERALWLLESGAPALTSQAEVDAVRLTRDAFERAEDALGLDRAVFAEVLARVRADRQRSPALRGACAGAAWSLRCAEPAAIRDELLLFADAAALGDYLLGLFGLAREEAQRDRELLAAIDALISRFDDQGFLRALPALRLAFTYFTAREKIHLAHTLFDAAEVEPEPPVTPVGVAEAIAAFAHEARLVELAAAYGVELEY